MIDLVAAVAGLAVPVPAGRLAVNEEGGGVVPALWQSDERPDAGLLRRLRDAHPGSGLWPVLVDVAPMQLWDDRTFGTPDAADAPLRLAAWWHVLHRDGPEAAAVPFGERWPRAAPPGVPVATSDDQADAVTRELLGDARRGPGRWRLGLVPAARGADVPVAVGWSGTVNHDADTTKFCSVLRSWEDRFGARLVAIMSDRLILSVAAPPADLDAALHLAAEHFAFCPDNLWQQGQPTVARYAPDLLTATWWSFWWD